MPLIKLHIMSFLFFSLTVLRDVFLFSVKCLCLDHCHRAQFAIAGFAQHQIMNANDKVMTLKVLRMLCSYLY